MKKTNLLSTCVLFCTALALSSLLNACSEDAKETPQEQPEQEEVIEDFPTTDFTFNDASGEQTFTFTTATAWSIQVAETRSGTDWCSVEPMSGEAGTHTVTITTQPNETYDDRSVTVTLRAGSESRSLEVTQRRKGAIILSEDSISVSSAGGTVEVKLNASVDFEMQLPDADWLSESSSRALQEYTKYLQVTENTGSTSRTAQVVFRNTESNVADTLIVSQASKLIRVKIHVEKPGDLPELIPEEEAYKITELEVSGFLGGRDIELLAQMAGRNRFNFSTYLTYLDMSKATIVGDGEPYYTTTHGLYPTDNTIGDSMFTDCQGLQTIILPDNLISIRSLAFIGCPVLQNVIIPQTVTSIGSHAFKDCPKLTHIVLPDNLTSIEAYTFSHSGITEITIPNKVTSIEMVAFEECHNLTRITINSAASIKDGAFRNCTKLAEVTLPNNLTLIDDFAFERCTNLKGMIIPESVKTIGWSAFSGCNDFTIEIPETVDSLGLYVFEGENLTITLPIQFMSELLSPISPKCENLKVIISDGATSIPERLFLGYSGLTSIVLPNTVTSIGETAFAKCSTLTDITIPNSVTSIGNNAFSECSNLPNIIIPNSVTSMGTGVFSDCSNLSSVILPNTIHTINVSTFNGCNSLGTFEIPDHITSIGDAAFSRCTNLSMTIPEYIELGYGVFSGCNNLSVTIPAELYDKTLFGDNSNLHLTLADNGVTTIDEWAFSNLGLASFVMPNSVTSIGNGAFNDCSSLSDITFSENLSSINFMAFEGCTSLTKVTLPEKLSLIGEAAFRYCSGLSDILIPNSVKTIDRWAFDGCKSLVNVTIPDGVTSIKDGAFANCTSLSQITIPNSVTLMGPSVFEGCSNLTLEGIDMPLRLWETPFIFSGCTGIKSVTIPKGVTSISDNAFSGCTELTTLVIPEYVTSIGYGAFASCTHLTDITMDEGIKRIGGAAFNGCDRLSSIIIPNSVTTMEIHAFSGCPNLIDVTLGSGISYLNEGVFGNSPIARMRCYALVPPGICRGANLALSLNEYEIDYETAVLYVPSASVAAYANSDWAKYFKNIVSM